jgi:monoamine oxidase
MPSSEVDIAIVGGGAAGIAAARRLARSGPSVRLFEASPRLGGRAWSQEIRGFKLDLGAGWLHSADRNAWVKVAEQSGIAIDRTPAAWGVQYRDLGFSRAEQSAARKAFEDWSRRLATSPPASDRASDGLEAGEEWNTYVAIIAGFLSGAPPDRLSATDYSAYDEASTKSNWRVASGYGDLVAQSYPPDVPLSVATPIESLELGRDDVNLRTHAGELRAGAVILALPTTVLSGDSIKLPGELAPWREAAAQLPLGHTEKFFLEIAGRSPFDADKQVLGNPRDPSTASYYLMPFGLPVIECFLSADGTQRLETGGPAAAFTFAIDQLAALFGSDVRRILRPLVASSWSRMVRIGGAYSYALPGQRDARRRLATPFEQRVFFAGEATSESDYSTVHGAHDSGVRAAEECLRALAAEPNRPTALHSSHGQAQVAAPT